jgi:hypothetical protein
MAITKSGTVKLTVEASGKTLVQTHHVTVRYVCPDVVPSGFGSDIDYPFEMIVQARNVVQPTSTRPLWMYAPWRKLRDLGVDADGFREATYLPENAHDDRGYNLVFREMSDGAVFRCRIKLVSVDENNISHYSGSLMYMNFVHIVLYQIVPGP